MQLLMYIGNDLIEAISVIPTQIARPGYLGQYKRELQKKHQSLIQQSADDAEFLIIYSNPTVTQKNDKMTCVPSRSTQQAASYQ
jgi:hypothetical protein